MPQQFIHPNWHPLLIHAPLGLLAIGLFIEIFSFLWRNNLSVQAAGRWMILLGALCALPAATSGIYAFRMAIGGSHQTDTSWYEVKAKSPWSDAQWHMMTMHLRLAAIGAGVAAIVACIWLAGSDEARYRLRWPALGLIAAGFILMGLAAWFSGESVYTQGTAVTAYAPQARPAAADTSRPATASAGHSHSHDENDESDEGEGVDARETVEYYAPPLQMHVLLAGCFLSLALASIAITIRRWKTAPPYAPPGAVEAISARLTPTASPPPHKPASIEMAFESPPPPPPPSLNTISLPWRYWTIAMIFVILTAIAGVWTSEDFNLQQLLHTLVDSQKRAENLRLFVHIVFALSLVFFSILLVLFTIAPHRWRKLATLIVVLLLIAAGGQIYMGILLTYDSMSGPLTHFNEPTTAPAK